MERGSMRGAPLQLEARSPTTIRLLFVEDSQYDVELSLCELERAGFDCRADVAQTREELASRLSSAAYDVVLADYQLPGWTGLEALSALRESGMNIPLILVTGSLGEKKAVECIKLGVTDYVLKGQLELLPTVIRGALKERALCQERLRAEKALRESEARYRSLFESATYGIFRAAVEGELLDVNPALTAMLGFSSEADLLALGNVEQVFQDPEEQARLAEQCTASSRADMEADWRRKDGQLIKVRLRGRKVPDKVREADCLEVIVEDVTHQVALERQLRQAQKFEAIGQLAGGIAHDFNNLIGAILGWAELGMEETDSQGRLHSYFQKMQQQAERAAALTRQLLAFARRQVLEPRDIELNKTIDEILGFLGRVIGSDIEVKTSMAADLAVIRADPTQVEQVLMNLCLNARDAMPQGGRLLIETANVEFDGEDCRHLAHVRPGRYVQLTVSDTGIGMDAATLDHIFEPFFTTKEKGKGTGLGLATVYGIVKQHGGFLHVSSRPGQGSSFHIHIPASQGVPGAPPKTSAERTVQGGTETVLLAEDHEGLREIARETLVHLGYSVLLATDGEEACEKFQTNRNQVALLLLDVVLPKLGGLGAYAKMSREKPGLPVLFVTGYSTSAAMLAEVQEKGLPVLQKPYTPRDLAHKVREVLDRSGRG